MAYCYRDLPDAFTREYVQAALDTSIDDSEKGGGRPFSRNYQIWNIDKETIEDMILDCKEFQEANATDLELISDFRELGSYFWTNRHYDGIGFWSLKNQQQLAEVQAAIDRLTEAAHRYGDYNLYASRGAVRANRTRASDARCKRRKKARLKLMTGPHARCKKSDVCVEHAANKRVVDCKESPPRGRSGRGRRQK